MRNPPTPLGVMACETFSPPYISALARGQNLRPPKKSPGGGGKKNCLKITAERRWKLFPLVGESCWPTSRVASKTQTFPGGSLWQPRVGVFMMWHSRQIAGNKKSAVGTSFFFRRGALLASLQGDLKKLRFPDESVPQLPPWPLCFGIVANIVLA